jgi:hypothetical protein
MRNGERWRCTIVALQNNTVRIRVAPFGTADIDVQLVAVIVFNETGSTGGKVGRLYRTHGNPISGRLTGVSASAVSLDSSLGVFNIDRKDVGRYVIAPSDLANDRDELQLVNGSRFHATLAPASGKLEVVHPVLGTASIGTRAIFCIRRRSTAWTRPDRGEVTAATGPLGKPEAPRWLPRTAGTQPDAPPWIEALRVEADTTVKWASPDERPRRFSTTVEPAGLHDGTLIALAGEQVLSKLPVSRSDSARPWTVTLPAGQSLSLRFTFDDPPGMPCAVLIGDPILFGD